MVDTEIITSRPSLAKRFEVVGLLGEGAAGTVYRVRDKERDNEEVALKILTNLSAFDEHTLERFRQEIRICQKIHHKNIVHAYGLVGVDDTIAYTMEYVPGCDLGSLMRERAIELPEIEHIFSQILSALHELHSHGVVHRDLKLENILIRNDGVVKLSDLGLMKELGGEGLTKTGILLGTAQYLPPEYIRTGVYDEKGDLYATGAMLLELLSGKRRLADKQGMEAINHLIKTKFALPPVVLQGLSKKYAQVISRAMDPKPSKRYQSAIEMREAIQSEDGYGGEQEVARMDAKLRFSAIHAKVENRRSRHSLYYSLFSALLLLVGGLGAFSWYMSDAGGPTLDFGSYEGEIRLESGEVKRVLFRSDQRGLYVKYPDDNCKDDYKPLVSGLFVCGANRYSVSLEATNLGGYQGTWQNLSDGTSYPLAILPLKRTLRSG